MEETFTTDDPHLKPVYGAVNAILAQQKLLVEMLHKPKEETDNDLE